MRPYDLTTHDGKVVDQLTHYALLKAEGQLGYELTIVQGSYNKGVGASAGTHDGGGVVDLAPFEHERKVRVLRRVGFAAWYRPERPGVWPAHIHAVLIGNRKLSPAAQDQVQEYLDGYDGLAGDGLDNGPRDFVNHRFTWEVGQKRITRAGRLIEKAERLLSTGIRGFRVGKSRRALRNARRNLP